ncbi:hypothetical protein RRG08_036137 [Elysia crispata]|uniref:Uncharacterized protein n=1 Tax=Elysia crispata TaxID=231223 RepID=A0AAE1DH53_9GAST|nr:hypothetical protein RRG08_036137 [Elysia crispata]
MVETAVGSIIASKVFLKQRIQVLFLHHAAFRKIASHIKTKDTLSCQVPHCAVGYYSAPCNVAEDTAAYHESWYKPSYHPPPATIHARHSSPGGATLWLAMPSGVDFRTPLQLFHTSACKDPPSPTVSLVAVRHQLVRTYPALVFVLFCQASACKDLPSPRVCLVAVRPQLTSACKDLPSPSVCLVAVRPQLVGTYLALVAVRPQLVRTYPALLFVLFCQASAYNDLPSPSVSLVAVRDQLASACKDLPSPSVSLVAVRDQLVRTYPALVFVLLLSDLSLPQLVRTYPALVFVLFCQASACKDLPSPSVCLVAVRDQLASACKDLPSPSVCLVAVRPQLVRTYPALVFVLSLSGLSFYSWCILAGALSLVDIVWQPRHTQECSKSRLYSALSNDRGTL